MSIKCLRLNKIFMAHKKIYSIQQYNENKENIYNIAGVLDDIYFLIRHKLSDLSNLLQKRISASHI